MIKYVILIAIIVVVCFFINPILGVIALGLAAGYAVYTSIPAYYTTKGNRAFAAGDEEQTLKWYKKAVDTGRANVTIKTSYAYILLRTGRPEEAETVLNGVLMNRHLEKEKKYYAKQNKCMVLYKLGRMDEAVEEAEELFEVYKNSAMYGMLGYFKLLQQEDLQETLKFCLEAYDYNSDDRDIQDNLSVVYYRLGEYEKASEISDKLVESQPKFVEAYYHGAMIAHKCGNDGKAAELLARLDECRRSYLTTVTQEEIEALKREIDKQ